MAAHFLTYTVACKIGFPFVLFIVALTSLIHNPVLGAVPETLTKVNFEQSLKIMISFVNNWVQSCIWVWITRKVREFFRRATT